MDLLHTPAQTRARARKSSHTSAKRYRNEVKTRARTHPRTPTNLKKQLIKTMKLMLIVLLHEYTNKSYKAMN
jgi:hypothetical protein